MKHLNRFYAFFCILTVALGLGACTPDLGACTPESSSAEVKPTTPVELAATSQPPQSDLEAILQVPAALPDGNSVELVFTLINHSQTGVYVLPWYTPLEGLGGEIFRVERDRKPIPYNGPLAMRGDPTPDAYVYLEAGAAVSAMVDLVAAGDTGIPIYDFSEPGEYTIAFISPRISHVARTEGEIPASMEDLGPVRIPSNRVRINIDGSSGETMEAAPSSALNSVLMGYIRDEYEQDGHRTISFDEIEWLSGADAAKARREDGLCGSSEPDCESPNGFYIQNPSENTVHLRVSREAAVFMQTLSHAPDGNYNWDERIDLERFLQVLDGDATAHLRSVPYQITLVGGVVTIIREQYVP